MSAHRRLVFEIGPVPQTVFTTEDHLHVNRDLLFNIEVEKGKRSPLSFVSTVLQEGKTLYVRRDRNRAAAGSQGQK